MCTRPDVADEAKPSFLFEELSDRNHSFVRAPTDLIVRVTAAGHLMGPFESYDRCQSLTSHAMTLD